MNAIINTTHAANGTSTSACNECAWTLTADTRTNLQDRAFADRTANHAYGHRTR